MVTRKTIGLALGSGAYRGFAHIGVIKSLEKHGIPIDYLSGSSIGAWVAAYYAIFKDISVLEKDLINNTKENLALLFDLSWSGGFIDGRKFTTYLEKKLQSHDFSALKIPLQIVATDLISGDPYIFKSGDVARAVRASTSVPLLFKPIQHEGKILVDGGISHPVPGDLVRSMGADLVISVNLYNSQEFKSQKITVPSIIVRSTMAGLYNLSRADLKSADIIIEPDTSPFVGVSSLSKYFTKEVADKLIAIGAKATDKVIPEIKKRMG